MTRPVHDLRVHGAQDRRTDSRVKRPWIARWTIDGLRKSKSFRTKAEADRYLSLLLQAAREDERFDLTTGEPESWSAAPFAIPEPAFDEPLDPLTVHEWARRWLGEQWTEWQPRTRKSAVESLVKLVMLAVDAPKLTKTADEQLRHYLAAALPPHADATDARWNAWLDKHSLTLPALDRETVGPIDRGLGLRLDGKPLAATTANRTRIVARACVIAAVHDGLLAGDPWPPRSRTRARRKVARLRRSVDLRRLPDPATMARAIEALTTHQPGSANYRVMTAVAYYAGLRPSEVVMLRVGSLDLPVDGWGRLHVTEADISFDEPGEPRTGPRVVPIPPVLVGILSAWIDQRQLVTEDQLLFRTPSGSRPNQSNWVRAWHRALASIGQPPLRVYDCRHAAATTWLRSGLPLGETAKRLGHSVDTLVKTYVGALDDEEVVVGNAKIERFLDGSSG